jgi:excisionase family DNA binding protein
MAELHPFGDIDPTRGARVMISVDFDLVERLVDTLDRATGIISEQERRLAETRRPSGLSIRDAAHELGVSVSTVERMTAAGEITPVRLAGRRIYPRHEIDRVLGATIASPVRSVS